MKNLYALILISVIFLTSCSKIDDQVTINDNGGNYTTEISLKSRDVEQPKNIKEYSNNQIVVRYGVGITDQQKQIIRAYYNAQRFDVCSYCIDQNIEKWEFNSSIDIETKLSTIIVDEPISEGLLGADREFIYGHEYENYILSGGTGDFDYVPSVLPPNSNGVRIAILDTGIDVNYPVFSATPFLRNGANDPISQVVSGWDFVNNDHNSYDDNMNLHGTAVSAIINKTLTNLNTPHEIIPVKISDANGVSSYFKTLCGLQFSLERADIVQMSSGWYRNDNSNSFVENIFLNLINQYKDEVLIVTSAGNSSNNNDGEMAHYPSNFNSSNILAVGASNRANSDIASFSNYGAETVDFFAPGENLHFNGRLISGTSFSAPLVSAIAAKLFYNSGRSLTPADLIVGLNDYGVTVSYSKPTVYSKLISVP